MVVVSMNTYITQPPGRIPSGTVVAGAMITAIKQQLYQIQSV